MYHIFNRHVRFPAQLGEVFDTRGSYRLVNPDLLVKAVRLPVLLPQRDGHRLSEVVELQPARRHRPHY